MGDAYEAMETMRPQTDADRIKELEAENAELKKRLEYPGLTWDEGNLRAQINGQIVGRITWKFVKVDGKEQMAFKVYLLHHRLIGATWNSITGAQKILDDYIHKMWNEIHEVKP